MRAVFVLLLLFGCEQADSEPGRAAHDAAPIDRGLDAALLPDGALDATLTDAGSLDRALPTDPGLADARPIDARPPDALGPVDDAAPDAVSVDAALVDALPDAEVVDFQVDQALGPPRAARPGDLLFTELMPGPEAVRDEVGEWIEVVNRAAEPIILDGLELSDGADELARVISDGPVRPGRFAVLTRGADPATNGGVQPDGHYEGLSLSSRRETVILRTAEGVEIDRLEYDDDRFPIGRGASVQLDADVSFDADTADGAQWCRARTPYGAGDLGTPGAPNIACRAAFSAAEFQQVIVETCPGCHTQAGRLGGLNLDDHTRIIDRPSVFLPEIDQIEPGDRMRSYLYLKLLDTHRAVGGRGERMPPKVPLDPTTIERIGRYIDALPVR